MLTPEEKSRVLLGCQGWRYADWRKPPTEEELEAAPEIFPAGFASEYGDESSDDPRRADLRAPFYIKQIQPRDELKHYSMSFPAVEVDSTFYAIPQRAWVRNWAAAVGDDFRFALKLPRIITHDYGLQRGRGSLNEFCSVASELGDKLHSILVQLPPSFAPEFFDVLARFLPHLPKEIRFAVEFRDPGWITPATRDLLAQHNVAFMLGPTPWLGTKVAEPMLDGLPADWLYIRLMGDRDEMSFSHLQIDRDRELDTWAAHIKRMSAAGTRVLALADNHYQGYSPGTSLLLARRLDYEIGPFPGKQPIGDQMNLF